MTAALAHQLRAAGLLPRAPTLDPTWSRSGDFLFAAGHVNITVGRRMMDAYTPRDLSPLTIDFLPPADLRRLATREIGEATVLAMYENNRAAEALIADRVDDAYAWADRRAAQRPGLPSRVQHAWRRLPAAWRPERRGAGLRLRPGARAEKHPGDGQPRRNRRSSGREGRRRRATRERTGGDRIGPGRFTSSPSDSKRCAAKTTPRHATISPGR